METRSSKNHHPRGFGDQRRPRVGKTHKCDSRHASSHGLTNQLTTIIQKAIEADKLSEIETLLRIEAQAKCKSHQVYYALYRLTRDRGDQHEANQWALEWIYRPAKSKNELWKQARIARQLREPKQHQQLIDTLCRKKGQAHPGALLSQIKKDLSLEHWGKAQAWIKQLRANDPKQETWKQLEAFCILERAGGTPAEKTKSIQQLKISKNKQQNKVSRLVHSRTLYEQGDIETAYNMIKDDIKVNPNGMGLERLIVPILMHKDQISTAKQICEQLLETQPNANQLRRMHGQCLLRQGQWLEGFNKLCTSEDEEKANKPPSPREIYCDTSISDCIFYSRWLQYFETRDNTLHAWVPSPLLRLFKTNFPFLTVKTITNKKADALAELTPISTLPREVKSWSNSQAIDLPHLRVDNAIREEWRERLGKSQNDFWIGVNWHGSALSAAVETFKSDIPLDAFSPLASMNDCCLISLQKGTGSEQLSQCNFIERFHPQQATISREHRMEHMAAIISLCDLVICDDSGPGHLASNLGVPTIVNVRPSSSWHWHNANLERGFYRSTTANPFTETWKKTMQNAAQMAQEAIQIHL